MTTMNRLVLLMILCCSKVVAFVPPSTTTSFRQVDTRRYNLLDKISSVYNNWGKEVTVSHIHIGPRMMNEDQAKAKLTEIKAEINDDPQTFAEMAAEYSQCPSSKKGGSLGTFGPAVMVENFDKVCFEEQVGVVHGPISTQFGEHLILIHERTGE